LVSGGSWLVQPVAGLHGPPNYVRLDVGRMNQVETVVVLLIVVAAFAIERKPDGLGV
jgi:hypothetical protein